MHYESQITESCDNQVNLIQNSSPTRNLSPKNFSKPTEFKHQNQSPYFETKQKESPL